MQLEAELSVLWCCTHTQSYCGLISRKRERATMYSTLTVFDLDIWQNSIKGEGFLLFSYSARMGIWTSLH